MEKQNNKWINETLKKSSLRYLIILIVGLALGCVIFSILLVTMIYRLVQKKRFMNRNTPSGPVLCILKSEWTNLGSALFGGMDLIPLKGKWLI